MNVCISDKLLHDKVIVWLDNRKIFTCVSVTFFHFIYSCDLIITKTKQTHKTTQQYNLAFIAVQNEKKEFYLRILITKFISDTFYLHSSKTMKLFWKHKCQLDTRTKIPYSWVNNVQCNILVHYQLLPLSLHYLQY